MASISKAAVFDKVGFRPHAGQVPILSSTARNRVVSAGRRFGKSVMGGHELVAPAYLAYFNKEQLKESGHRHEYWIVGPEYSDSEKEFRVLYNDLSRLGMPFDKPGTYNNPLDGNMHISLWGGAYQVHAKSAKYPETLVGEGLMGVQLVEAAKLKERIWTKFVRPTLADFHGWSWMTSTPEGRNWFYRAWQEGQDDSNPEWASWRCPSWQNPKVYPLGEADPEIVSLRRDLSSAMFNTEIGADFSEFVGRVFAEFDEEVHVANLQFDPKWETFAAVDYGFTNPFVWLLVQRGPFGHIRVLGEVYEPGLDIPEAAAAIKAKGLAPGALKRFYPDPASPGDSRQLSNLLRTQIGNGTGGEVKNRIEWIKRFLKVPDHLQHLDADHPERIPMLQIDRSCVNTIRDFNNYRYPKSADEAQNENKNLPELPMKKDDHAPEALGRFFAGMYGTTPGRRARSASADMSG